MSEFRFVHAADLHLDSPMQGLERYPSAPVDAVRSASRAALRNLVDLCLAEEADFLLLAGDLYDGDWRDYHTGLAFAAEMARLAVAGIRVVWIRGNHDAASQITRRLRLAEGVTELPADAPGSQVFEDLGVAVHGQSYPQRDVTDNLASAYPPPHPDLFNIGLLHTALEGRAGHAPYAPCRLSDLVARGYDYWALGHVHARDVVHREPWVVFPGNLQGRHSGECGPKGASLVEVEAGRVASVEHRPLDVVRWARIAVDLEGVDSIDSALERSVTGLHEAALAAEGRILAARLELSGRCGVHEALLGDPERWLAELQAHGAEVATEVGVEVWIEQARLRTQSSLGLAAIRSGGGPLGELLAAMAQLEARPEGLEGLLEGLEELRRKLPAELGNSLDIEELFSASGLAARMPESAALLAARLIDVGPGRVGSGEERS